MTSMIGGQGYGMTGANAANSGNATGSPFAKTQMQKLGGYRQFTTQQFTPEQMQLFSQLFGNLGPNSFLSKLAGGDQSLFEQMEAPALKQFEGLQGQLASRFSGMGTGARRSSGFQNTSNQAASDFAQQLQANRLGLQNQAIRDLMGLGNQLLGQRPYEQVLAPKGRSFLEELALAGMGAAGETARGFFGGKK